MKKTVSLLLVISMISTPAAGLAGAIPGSSRAMSASSLPAPVAGALPELRGIIQGIDRVDGSTAGVLNIVQNDARAVVEWQSFDVGSGATVNFVQQQNSIAQSSWVALNRIYQQNPSQIFGKLTADGTVYLINQNGILFGAGSQVNVGALIAASLNMTDSDFLAGTLRFAATGNYNPEQAVFTGPGAVVNRGAIRTGALGSVFFMGPEVENQGSIDTPSGQIGLAAGEAVSLTADPTARRTYFVEYTRDRSDATYPTVAHTARNAAGGTLTAEAGVIGLYGGVVNQNGLIRAVTTKITDGLVELMAAHRITTGADSVTSVALSDSAETIIPADDKKWTAEIRLSGITPASTDPLAYDFGYSATGSIEHNGLLQVPGGTVTLLAESDISLDTGRIDVSGAWVDKAAAANLIELTLATENMRDDFGQKNGMLMGQKIKVDAHEGTGIGILEGYLKSQEKTAREQYLAGGSVYLTSTAGTVSIGSNAALDFSGGGVRYAGGSYATTVLQAANGRTYDISSAPQYLTYTAVGERVRYHAAHTEGSDAGLAQIVAGTMSLQGSLDGSVTRGVYQTLTAEPTDSLGRQAARGRREPEAGRLILGVEYQEANQTASLDAKLHEVVVTAAADPRAGSLNPDGSRRDRVSYIEDAVLGNAGLGTLEIYANRAISTEQGSRLELVPGGVLKAYARRIVHGGSVLVPAGTVDFTAHGNRTSFSNDPANPGAANAGYLDLVNGVYLLDGSSVSTAGLVIDNALAYARSGHASSASHINGGMVTLRDITFEGTVMLAGGSAVDAGGGLLRTESGAVSGGTGGSISLHGYTLLAAGDLQALAVYGRKGGSLAAHAGAIALTPTTLLPESYGESMDLAAYHGALTLPLATIAAGGFATIDLKSAGTVTVADGVTLAPSDLRLALPVAGRVYRRTTLRAGSDFLGATAIKLAAGSGLSLKDEEEGYSIEQMGLAVSQGAVLRTAAAGELALSGPQAISVAGALAAPAGKIAITGRTDGIQSLVTLQDGASLSVAAYNRPDAKPIAAGYPLGHTALDAGTVTISGHTLNLAAGSTINVSGSSPATGYVKTADGRIVRQTVAGKSGSVALTFSGDSTINSEFTAASYHAGLAGGSLTLKKVDPFTPLRLDSTLVDHLAAGGFASYTFASNNALQLNGPLGLTAGVALTLDAPLLTMAGADQARFAAPYLRLANSYATFAENRQALAGSGSLALAGQWLDLDGSVYLSGIGAVTAQFSRDIRLLDRQYKKTDGSEHWEGLLAAPGDLTLQADRIYTAMHYADATTTDLGLAPSDFTLRAGGTVTTLPTASPSATRVYSAGGSLTVEAGGNIIHRGLLAAPLGTVTLTATGADGIVYLADGSSIITGAGGAMNYGFVDENTWKYREKNSGTYQTVDELPDRGITLTGATVVVAEGAQLDVSGGGTLYGYQFQAGVEGTANPLAVGGSFVVVPGNLIQAPGAAVYLSGSSLLAAGVYTVLPVQYAFLPGALVVTSLGSAIAPGEVRTTAAGYTVVGGYSTTMGSGVTAPALKSYQIRTAGDVLKEGNFTVAAATAGDGGSLSVIGDTTVLNGDVSAAPLSGSYQGGSVTLAGRNVSVQEAAIALGSYDPTDPTAELPAELVNNLFVSAAFLNGKGFSQVKLGAAGTTETIRVEAGSELAADRISLTADGGITLEENVTLRAVTGDGSGALALQSGSGTLLVGSGSLLRADGSLSLDAADLDLQGDLRVDGGTLSLTGAEVILAADGTPKSTGLFLTQSQWDRINGRETVHGATTVLNQGPTAIRLRSRGSVTFQGDFALAVAANPASGVRGDLAIDAGRIAAAAGTATVTVAARDITLQNSGAAVAETGIGETAALALQADRQLTVAGGTVSTNSSGDYVITAGAMGLDGFRTAELRADSDLTFLGKGSLATDGDLSLTSARVTTDALRDATHDRYVTADFAVTAGGAVAIAASGGTAGTTTTPGGRLAISGRSIDQNGSIETVGGRVTLAATGSDPAEGITLGAGAKILAAGSADAAGGRVTLAAAAGAISLAAGSLLDVSADGQGEGGILSLAAATGGVVLDGTIAGTNGSFALATNRIDTLAPLAAKLADGGFSEALAIRTRSGDLSVAAGDSLGAKTVTLSADGGSVLVSGSIDASGEAGGNIALYGTQAVQVENGGRLAAAGLVDGGDGGTVLLSSSAGTVALQTGSTVDVSAGAGGTAGTVSLAVARSAGNDEVQATLAGTVSGAGLVDVVGFKAVQYSGAKTTTAGDATGWLNDAGSFMASGTVAAIRNRLTANLAGLASPDLLRIRPGIDVRATGPLTFGTVLDLTTTRYDGVAGVLLLRSADNLAMDNNLVDHPTSRTTLQTGTEQSSWDLGLVAGADFAAASPWATTGGATLSIKADRSVYTESGTVRLASAGDTVINAVASAASAYMGNASMNYSLGTFAGSVTGEVGGNLQLKGGVIQSANGDLTLAVAGDLLMESASVGSGASRRDVLGAIRTTGAFTSNANTYQTYTGGGDITLDVAGAVNGRILTALTTGSTSAAGWDFGYTTATPKVWSASYDGNSATQGIAAMAGGSVTVTTGGAFTSQAGTFGTGDLTIVSGGDLAGRFLVRDGDGLLQSFGSFAPRGSSLGRQVIELFNGSVAVTAQGDVLLGAVLNPTLANINSTLTSRWNPSYGSNAAISLNSLNGDVVLAGVSAFVLASAQEFARILPASVTMAAAGDIALTGDYILMPAVDRTLQLVAGGSIIGSGSAGSGSRATVNLPDADPAYYSTPRTSVTSRNVISALKPSEEPRYVAYQSTGTEAIVFSAGNSGGTGDIANLALYLTKRATIEASGDIRNLYYFGQNVSATDTTVIRAGGDIRLWSIAAVTDVDRKRATGIIHGGPGSLIVQAGGTIDLGTTQGIQAVGNKWNIGLSATGSDLLVAAGFPTFASSSLADGEQYLDLAAVRTFFARLAEYGDRYASLLAEGKTDEALQVVADARSTLIRPFTGLSAGSDGNLNMTNAEISSNSGSPVSLLVNGDIYVGKTAIGSAAKDNSGIYTSAGGSIDIYAEGDVNVNESRVMSFRGGNILTWSDQGSINAGRGSRTAISASPPKTVYDPETETYSIEFTPPSLGSGYRAVTYDPDGPEGPQTAPEAGNVQLYAPSGIIDAGEAGISGNKVLIGANAVLNAKNISFSSDSVGFSSGDTTVNLSAVSGVSELADSGKMIEHSALGSAKSFADSATDKVGNLMAGWLDVKVISFDEEDEQGVN